MATQHEYAEIPKEFGLRQIERAIMLEESLGYVFEGNEIRSRANGQYNRAAFSIYRKGSYPPDCRAQFSSEAAPTGHDREWSGQMLVNERPRQVVLYRRAEASVEEGLAPGVLSKGSEGVNVARWQTFLSGQGFEAPVDGTFDKATETATRAFQKKHKLFVDGEVGNESYGQAALLGFEVVDYTVAPGSGYPAKPTFPPLLSTAERQKVFGRFEYQSDPRPNNPEHIRILGDWVQKNIVNVTLPQLQGVRRAPRNCRVPVHRLAENPIVALWAAWEKAGLLDRIITWDGAFVPRYIRGSRSVLSNHAFGTAFDINADFNRLGAEPAWPGKEGCVFDLVEIANAHGFFWGGHFNKRRDGMHFELALPDTPQQ